ncbi:2-hydroxychromene-2-carboxylate isomerase [Sphingomonas psychrolutea]|uniref:2-hydroxychromene-2-carboxylate isomerase n=1 Tax=Sphingomonas psychrolutea TaxID=1259676 RepID=A0ABQ1G9Z1_9SPHN|nr:DsbA family protein [Sphingomonas psychrolutea]GGA39659.1 DSBA oxidoreductase [Sphingomonas psychrolutea]
MTLTADLYFSFRSPYSYLAMPKCRAAIARYDLDIALRPVYPLAIREPTFFERNHPNWLRYTFLDVLRLAQHDGITMLPPRPDPIVQDIATRQIAAEQPYIFALVRMGQAAARRGRGFAFADAVSQLIWGGTEGWHADAHLAAAAQAAGLDFAELQAEARDDAVALDAELAANQAALEAAGHWGVPTLVFNGEPFFGQDRVDLAIARMKAAGLEERA